MKFKFRPQGQIATLAMLAFFLLASTLLPFQAQARISALAQLIDINDDSISPDTITIKVGEKVTWVNDGEQEHTLTSADGQFSPVQLAPDGHKTVAFHTPGVYQYACSMGSSFNRGIIGQIIVKENETP